ncbi:MAG: glutathione S-transferase family protein [Pseudomonadota bacterium]
MKIYIGNKNYSSWSLRGWLAVRLAGLPFEEEVIPLDTPEFATRIAEVSPSRLVPVLHDGDVVIWDSLAMIEYLNEKAPDAGYWPSDRATRAKARSVAAEMHSGFTALRGALPMNIRKLFANYPIEPAVQKNIDRIQDVWEECLDQAPDGGFLFGALGAADIMYAPVVHRFNGYDVDLRPKSATYVQTMLAHPFMVEWADAGRAESWVIAADEVEA